MNESMQQDKKDRWWDILARLTPLIVGLFVTGLGTFATHVYQTKELQLAQLKLLNEFRPLLKSDRPADRAFAYQVFMALGYENLVLNLVRASDDPSGRPALTALASIEGPSQKAAKQALSTIPVYVYLHIADQKQRKSARQIQAEIERSLKFVVRGIENVSGKAESPSHTSVRYFNSGDAQAAQSLVTLLHSHGFTDAKSSFLRLRARPGTVEIWFAKPKS